MTASTTDTPQVFAPPTHNRSRRTWIIVLASVVVVCAALCIGVVGLFVVAALGADPPKPSEVACLVGYPLVPEGTTVPMVTDAEMFAALSSKLAEASRIADGDGELASVAGEYRDALASLETLLKEGPSAQPLIRSGLDAWKGSLEDDDRAFLLGLIGVGSELSKFSEASAKFSTIHTKIVACRLRVAEIAAREALPESPADIVSAAFSESGGWGTVESDTLALTNVSGLRLTNVLVVTELTGRSGERFSNLYYAESWEPNEVLLAVCQSAAPARETVQGVVLVRFRVISDQRTSRLGELQTTE